MNLKCQPILLNKLDEIAYCLSMYNNNSNNIIGDNIGIALFYLYYSRLTLSQIYYDKGFKIISNIIDFYNKDINRIFSINLSKFGWLVENLRKTGFIDINESILSEEIETILFKDMIDNIKNDNYDLLHGGLCHGLYFVSKLPDEKIYNYIDILVDELDKSSIITENKRRKWISTIRYDKNIIGYNIGMSHGMASIIAFLSKLLKLDCFYRGKIKNLLQEAINYLLDQKIYNYNKSSLFSNLAIESSNLITASRLAWCYGDLGIAISLWHASQALKNKNLEKEAINILLHSSLRRNLKQNGIIDAGICHGTTGIAHIFNRMYNYTNIEIFKETSEFWYKETLKMAKFEDGLVGYKSWKTEKYGGWVNDYGLLEGISGIGLALISAVSDIEPKWDECLLLS